MEVQTENNKNHMAIARKKLSTNVEACEAIIALVEKYGLETFNHAYNITQGVYFEAQREIDNAKLTAAQVASEPKIMSTTAAAQ